MLTALVWHGSVQNVRRAATIYLFLIHTWCYWGGCGSGGGAGRPLIKTHGFKLPACTEPQISPDEQIGTLLGRQCVSATGV